MNQRDFFAAFGAPLANVRWSWGAVRESDGAVFLRVWRDNVLSHDGAMFVRVTNHSYTGHQALHGHRERLYHLDLIRRGAPCYLVFCVAENPHAVPRTVRSFAIETVVPGGRVANIDGAWYIEMLSPVPTRDVMPVAGRGDA